MSRPLNFDQPIVRWLNDQAEQGIFTTDATLTIRGWNRWMEEYSGRTAVQVVGTHLFATFPDILERHLDAYYKDALRGQTQVLSSRFHGYLIWMASPHELRFPAMQQTARISPLVEEEKVVGTITVIEDVTERVSYEEDLRRTRDEAEAATRAKDHFIAILSHDLRTPLNAIAGWAQILKTGNLEPERLRRAIEAILQNASVQVQMIDDLLDVSRIASGKLNLKIETVDLLDLIKVAVEPLRQSIQAKSIQFIQVLPTTQGTASVDPKRIKQVLWNLLSNAVKFTPRGGTVEFVAEFSDDCAEFRVSDTGVGISPQSLPHIFKPMWQTEESERTEGGLGLGLSIVRQLVESHGGTVWAESAGLGHGSSFIVRLPWAGPASTADGKHICQQQAPRAS